jgi:hypothetical protein
MILPDASVAAVVSMAAAVVQGKFVTVPQALVVRTAWASPKLDRWAA